MNIADYLIAIDRAASAYESRIVAARLKYMEALKEDYFDVKEFASDAWATYRTEEIRAFSEYLVTIDNLKKGRNQ